MSKKKNGENIREKIWEFTKNGNFAALDWPKLEFWSFEKEGTVWKFHVFSITQILREIIFGDSRGEKSANLTYLEAMNLIFMNFCTYWCTLVQLIDFSPLARKNEFWKLLFFALLAISQGVNWMGSTLIRFVSVL